MAHTPTGKTEATTTWPLPNYQFIGTFTGATGTQGQSGSFSEVTGLETETQVIEYRGGASPAFHTVKMPGLQKVGNVTLKQGVFVKDSFFWDWFASIKGNTVARTTVNIAMVDNSDAKTQLVIWTLYQAFPTKVSGPVLKGDGNEVAIGSIEIAYEYLEVKFNAAAS